MSDSIEVTGPDIESAVQQALSQLGVGRDDVKIDVLEEPSRRLLGLGSKQARVRVTKIEHPVPQITISDDVRAQQVVGAQDRRPMSAPPAVAPPAQSEPIAQESAAPAVAQQAPDALDDDSSAPRPKRPPRKAASTSAKQTDFEDDDGDREPVSAEELDREAKVGADILQQLLAHMQIDATVTARRAETDGREEQHWLLEVTGQDLGALIGYRGETLASLQYITRLIASHQLERRAYLVIDVEGYKSRRESLLRRLANKMADQAVERGRTVSMEPMPPHERRIVHLALRDNPAVTTESVGDGEKRKVTIVPKKQPR